MFEIFIVVYEYGFPNSSKFIGSSEYIGELEERIIDLREEKTFLENSQLPLIIRGGLVKEFICRDYSKATNIGIANVEKRGDDYSTPGYGPAGSSRTDKLFFIPHFYSDFGKYKVIFQHETFWKDFTKMVFLEVIKDMSGSTIMGKKTKTKNLERVRGFFAEKNAPEKLLNDFEKLAKDIKDIISL